MIRLNLRERVKSTGTVTPAREAEPPDLLRPDLPAISERLQIGVSNRYEILPPLAIGGMATIFLMRHRLHRGLFVAKVLHPWLAELPEFLTSFRNEAAHAALLSGHPNIVPVVDLGEVDGVFYMVMPYVEGEDLDHLLKRVGRLERAEALMLVAQVNSALTFAESKGVLHCDLATGNIRLDTLGFYRVMDFGLSRMRGNVSSEAKWMAGTPLYTSPEQLRGEEPDIRSDLYSLGVILFEVLTGHPPFQAETLEALAEKHMAGAWKLPLDLESDHVIAPLLRSMLTPHRQDRIRNSLTLASRLAALGCSLPEYRERPHLEWSVPPDSTSMRRRLTGMSD